MGERRDVEVIGHGGAGDFFPGNSRMAIEQALRIGVDRIEFDVQQAGDGTIVLVHNDDVRMPDGRSVPVRRLSTPEIADVLPGLLTFDEAIELIGDRSRLLIDVKSPGYHDAVANAIRRHDLQSNSIVSSTWAPVLWRLRRELPDLRIGLSTGHMATGIPFEPARVTVSSVLRRAISWPLLAAVKAIGATDVMVQYRTCTPRLVRVMHDRGVHVNTWTVDHPKRIAMVLSMGVDAVISNRPDLVKDVLGSTTPSSVYCSADWHPA